MSESVEDQRPTRLTMAPIQATAPRPVIAFLYPDEIGDATMLAWLTGGYRKPGELTREERAVAVALLRVALENLEREGTDNG